MPRCDLQELEHEPREHLLVERARAHDEVVGAPGGGGGALERLRLIVLGLLPVAVVVLVLGRVHLGVDRRARRDGAPPTATREVGGAFGDARARDGRARGNRATGAREPTRRSVRREAPSRERPHGPAARSDVCDERREPPHPPRRRTAFRLFLLSRLEKIAVGRTFFLGW